MNREPVITVPYPGGGICRIPSIDLLITIKRSHLYLFHLRVAYFSFTKVIYYAVKWDAHINSYHELQKHRAASTSPSPLSNKNVLNNIQQLMTKEEKTLHAGKTIAPQLPPFSCDYDFVVLSDDQQVQLITSLLANYKTIFATFRTALEWACVTGPPMAADVIINHYPELVKVGEVIWEGQGKEGEEKYKQLVVNTNIEHWKHLKTGSNKLPPLSFGQHVLAAELNILNNSFPATYPASSSSRPAITQCHAHW
jgi:hypothetical protein